MYYFQYLFLLIICEMNKTEQSKIHINKGILKFYYTSYYTL